MKLYPHAVSRRARKEDIELHIRTAVGDEGVLVDSIHQIVADCQLGQYGMWEYTTDDAIAVLATFAEIPSFWLDSSLSSLNSNGSGVASRPAGPAVMSSGTIEQVGDLFGPFNKTIITGVKIFFISHIQRFILIFKPVKIKVKNSCAHSLIFIYNRKGRTGYRFLNAQTRA